MSNPWFRMYAEFAHDPKVQMLPEVMQRRYVMLMCMRCSNALVTLQADEIAFHLRIDAAQLEETKALFLAKGFINEAWELLNWEKRQFSSDTSAQRVAKHRAAKKAAEEAARNGHVTLPQQKSNALDTDTDTDTEEKRRAKATSKAEATASRLPADWSASADDIEFCKAERPDLVPAQTEQRFRDYWIAQPGVKGRKADWPATWRNWVRNERAPHGAAGRTAKFDPTAFVNRGRPQPGSPT
ncbi:hypothetical protein [Janthinobacterium sp. NKUCC08_JDC]|uniref:hypothetical protein n=1 Tax=Janthinobacterium sp. NKUCC08_JDC TaxID=2842122 RepID=UPI001C5AD951|nr:hypothetical protein [Janthinobacterium sp. NKUCC08_JDC]MBW3498855.1 hypothetical protein [Janthinobacterium sp. NKUCC08_JDC]